MLAKAHRIVRGGEYRTTIRHGVRSRGLHTVISVRKTSPATSVRFGFIVAKTVGSSVTRNAVRRRLKAVAWELAPRIDPGTDVVIRALPTSADAPWSQLRREVIFAIEHTRVLRNTKASM
ncbi:ribonuclease P protein component [Rathayibacter toxicus]|uniref:Ribonuclease P protein component n=1 Tax=Rathayibacter toxicus TaxID=145458 RepID=A0A0C5BD63_9MICO|nr:ribonuclease P protein component [Rathayibacter toxicus]AJM76924.1 hypothetical protein TI83_00935 [Rathayibacter toxicus]ALS57300.1 hypothetical protein APU90_05545 [Rathayibacter toxicus]KKM45730.1 hypothetical protein VT73_06165 [Rathayibacter toxicus]PPG24824.1 ribonuclease P protein component [Rathayibacter toxicus]PPG48279.1 ribonuclease P protein component [Rathayibacter toxicus]